MDNSSPPALTPEEIAYAERDPLSPSALILPDSRMHDTMKGTIHGKVGNMVDKLNWTPVFCANCAKPYGYVPADCTFACWLCDPCADKWGPQLGLAFMPEEIFWAKVAAEQLDKHGRVLTDQEMRIIAEGSTPLSKLLKEGS